MVSYSQSEDEFLDEGDLEFEPIYDDEDEEMAMLVLFMLMQQYFNDYELMSPEMIKERIQSDMDSLKEELTYTIENQLEKLVNFRFIDTLMDYLIPSGYVEPVYVSSEVIKEGLEAIFSQLVGDIKYKITYFVQNDLKIPFNIAPNFKRALKRINELFSYNLADATELSKRAVQKFVYKEDLWYWVCVKDMRTCRTCISLSEEPPKPMDMWGLDHPNGRCRLENASGEYSDKYKEILDVS